MAIPYGFVAASPSCALRDGEGSLPPKLTRYPLAPQIDFPAYRCKIDWVPWTMGLWSSRVPVVAATVRRCVGESRDKQSRIAAQV